MKMSNNIFFQKKKKKHLKKNSYILVCSKACLRLYIKNSVKTMSNLNNSRTSIEAIKNRITAINIKRSQIKKILYIQVKRIIEINKYHLKS